MSNEIIKDSEYEDIKSIVNNIKTSTETMLNNIDKVIDSFSNEEIVNSFYASGHYGEEEKEKLERLSKGIKDYLNVIDGEGGLVEQTINHCNHQISLLNDGTSSNAEKNNYSEDTASFYTESNVDSSGNIIDPHLSYKSSVKQFFGRRIEDIMKKD